MCILDNLERGGELKEYGRNTSIMVVESRQTPNSTMMREQEALLYLRMQYKAAGSIIGWGRSCATDAVPQLQVHWYSFCQPQKDDRLSQPHLV